MASASSSVSGRIAVPQEHFDDALVVDGGGHDALEDLLARVHDDDAVGDLVDEAHEMLDDEEGDAVARQLLEALGDAAELGRGPGGGELGGKEEARGGGGRARQGEEPLLGPV